MAQPPLVLLPAFAITVSMSFLIGLGLRQYYLAQGHEGYFGSVRTYTFIGLLGFGLYQVQIPALYPIGMVVLAMLLGIYYWHKTLAGRPGMIGVLTALLTYVIGPFSLITPAWFVILFVASILFALNAKDRIQMLAERLSQREVVTAATFMTLAGVVLPLLPNEQITELIPLTPYQIWLAVVVSTGLSYASYLLQRFVFKRQALLLSGILGGMYSSTMTTFVIARRTRNQPGNGGRVAGAIVAATGMMYFRMLVVVAVFDLRAALGLAPLFVALGALMLLVAFILGRGEGGGAQAATLGEDWQRNPLELTGAVAFGCVLVVMATATRFAMEHLPNIGLLGMALIAGLTEIEPFAVSLVQMQPPLAAAQIAQTLVAATAANNLLKVVYTVVLAERGVVKPAAGTLLACTLLSVVAEVFA
jgi:uncharacterized membrane protein (DUF4010 family)